MMVKMEKIKSLGIKFLIFLFIVLVIIAYIIFFNVSKGKGNIEKCKEQAVQYFSIFPDYILNKNLNQVRCSFFGKTCTCTLIYKFDIRDYFDYKKSVIKVPK